MDDLDYLTASELEPIDHFFSFSTSPEFSEPAAETLLDSKLLDHDETALVPGTLAYRKARKRRQNRESAARSRARKRTHLSKVEETLSQATELNSQLSLENSELKYANAQLREELEHYKTLVDPQSVKIRQPSNSKWLLVSSAFTLLCLVMVVEGESTAHTTPLSPGPRMHGLNSFSTHWPLAFVFAAMAVLAATIKIGECLLARTLNKAS